MERRGPGSNGSRRPSPPPPPLELDLTPTAKGSPSSTSSLLTASRSKSNSTQKHTSTTENAPTTSFPTSFPQPTQQHKATTVTAGGGGSTAPSSGANSSRRRSTEVSEPLDWSSSFAGPEALFGEEEDGIGAAAADLTGLSLTEEQQQLQQDDGRDSSMGGHGFMMMDMEEGLSAGGDGYGHDQLHRQDDQLVEFGGGGDPEATMDDERQLIAGMDMGLADRGTQMGGGSLSRSGSLPGSGRAELQQQQSQSAAQQVQRRLQEIQDERHRTQDLTRRTRLRIQELKRKVHEAEEDREGITEQADTMRVRLDELKGSVRFWTHKMSRSAKSQDDLKLEIRGIREQIDLMQQQLIDLNRAIVTENQQKLDAIEQEARFMRGDWLELHLKSAQDRHQRLRKQKAQYLHDIERWTKARGSEPLPTKEELSEQLAELCEELHEKQELQLNCTPEDLQPTREQLLGRMNQLRERFQGRQALCQHCMSSMDKCVQRLQTACDAGLNHIEQAMKDWNKLALEKRISASSSESPSSPELSPVEPPDAGLDDDGSEDLKMTDDDTGAQQEQQPQGGFSHDRLGDSGSEIAEEEGLVAKSQDSPPPFGRPQRPQMTPMTDAEQEEVSLLEDDLMGQDSPELPTGVSSRARRAARQSQDFHSMQDNMDEFQASISAGEVEAEAGAIRQRMLRTEREVQGDARADREFLAQMQQVSGDAAKDPRAKPRRQQQQQQQPKQKPQQQQPRQRPRQKSQDQDDFQPQYSQQYLGGGGGGESGGGQALQVEEPAFSGPLQEHDGDDDANAQPSKEAGKKRVPRIEEVSERHRQALQSDPELQELQRLKGQKQALPKDQSQQQQQQQDQQQQEDRPQPGKRRGRYNLRRSASSR